MGLFPCEATSHPYRGAQQTIYPAVVKGTHSSRRKLRLCPSHFERMLQALQDRAQSALIDSFDAPAVHCLVCGKSVEHSAFTFFATVYAKGEDREDFWAPLHEICVSAALEDWQLPVDIA